MEKVIQTYLQGARHKANNLPCEDRTYYLSQNGVDVIALADGAGSQKYSNAAQGAECVTKTICEFFCSHFDDVYETDDKPVKYAIMTVCQNALKERAKEIKIDDIIKMSSTLLCVAVKDNKGIAIHIGDGAIGGIIDSKIVTVSAPDNGEFASTTYFITMPQANEFLEINRFSTKNAALLFMMSDGTQEYSFDESDNTFTNGAAKMALYAFEKDGQKRLEETVQKMLIDTDNTSDDCSFIALRLTDKKPKVNFEEKVAPPKIIKNVDIDEGDSEMDKLEREKYNDLINSEKDKVIHLEKQVKTLKMFVVTLLAIAVILAAAICVQSSSVSKKIDELSKVTTETTTELTTVPTTESITELEGSTNNSDLEENEENAEKSTNDNTNTGESETSSTVANSANITRETTTKG